MENEGRHLGDLVRIAREFRGLSQRELAQKAGIGQSSLSELESPARRTPPNIQTFLRIMNVLDFSVSVTITPMENKPSASWNPYFER